MGIEKRKKWKENKAKNKRKSKVTKKKKAVLSVVDANDEMEPEMSPEVPDIHSRMESNISDFVIQSLTEVSPADFLHRLQHRAQSISKTNTFIQSIPKQLSVPAQ